MTELRDGVFETVQQCVVDSLAVDPADVTLQARLIDDLGADSLDFVDLMFMLDGALDIQLQGSELSFITRLDFSSPEVMKDGALTADVLERLEGFLPALAARDDKATVSPQQLFSLITIEALCIVCSRRLEARDASA